MNNLLKVAQHIPIKTPVTTISISPIVVPAPRRGLPLELRITAPMNGTNLPILLVSHGHGPSLYLPSKDGYGPMANFYAEQGFVVIQPTHLNSKVAGLDPSAKHGPLFWRSRVEDMVLILDQLDAVLAQVPELSGRLDATRVSAVGHSMGAQTIGMLLGARLTDPKDEDAIDVSLCEPRVKVGVLLAAAGNGGDDLSAFAAEHYSALNPDFSHMTTKTLVVMGDEDVNPHLTVRGADWHADPFHFGPGSDALLTLRGAKHGLGGVAGYDAKETDDEDPDRLAIVLAMTSAYLHSAFNPDDPAWAEASAALAEHARALATLVAK